MSLIVEGKDVRVGDVLVTWRRMGEVEWSRCQWRPKEVTAIHAGDGVTSQLRALTRDHDVITLDGYEFEVKRADCQTPDVQAPHEMAPLTDPGHDERERNRSDALLRSITNGLLTSMSESDIVAMVIDYGQCMRGIGERAARDPSPLVELAHETLARELEGQQLDEEASRRHLAEQRARVAACSSWPEMVAILVEPNGVIDSARDLGYRAGHNDRNRSVVRRLRGKAE